MKEKQAFALKNCISPVVVAILLMVVFACKGVYPFGTKNISYYDMSQSMIPIYYHTYDVLHGSKALFFDWYSGLGSSMADTVGNFVYSPFNLFFFFVKRDMILESMSYFLILKLSVAAWAMSFYFSKNFCKKGFFWSSAVGILYASGGFILQYYTNIHFLDIVAFFPLLVYALERMIKTGKKGIYTFIMALCLTINIYLMFMVCIYLILKSFFLIKEIEDKKIRLIRIFELAASTVTALFLSAFSVIPTVLQLKQSSRIKSGNAGYLSILLHVVCLLKEQKWFMLFGCEIAFALIVFTLVKRRTLLKCQEIKSSLTLIALLIIPIVIESVNILWHAGSYQHFPMRFGYMLLFECLVFIGKSLKDESQDTPSGDMTRRQRLVFLFALSMIPMMLVVLKFFMSGFLKYGIRDLNMYHAYGMIFIMLVLYYLFSFLSGSKKKIIVLVAVGIISQSVLGYYGFIAPEDDYSLECDDTIIKETQKIKKDFISLEVTERIKDNDTYLNTNYPFILEDAAISNWTCGINADMQPQLEKMGYSVNYSRLLDSGGTVFTDALLGIQYIFTEQPLNDNIYSPVLETENTTLYKMNYTAPFGIMTDSLMNENVEENVFSYQNFLFREFTEEQQELIKCYKADEYLVSEENADGKGTMCYTIKLPVEEMSVLYLYGTGGIYEFLINGERKLVPYLTIDDNNQYPAAFNNGLLECGVFEDETVEINVYTTKEALEDLQIGIMNVNRFRDGMAAIADRQSLQVKAGKNDIQISGTVKQDGYLFLPVGYNEGWQARINNKKCEVLPSMGNAFLAVRLEKGENEVYLHYEPAGLKIGIMISCFGILLVLIDKKLNSLLRLKGKYVLLFVNVLFGFTVAGVLIFIYAIPMIMWVVVQLVKTFRFGF